MKQSLSQEEDKELDQSSNQHLLVKAKTKRQKQSKSKQSKGREDTSLISEAISSAQSNRHLLFSNRNAEQVPSESRVEAIPQSPNFKEIKRQQTVNESKQNDDISKVLEESKQANSTANFNNQSMQLPKLTRNQFSNGTNYTQSVITKGGLKRKRKGALLFSSDIQDGFLRAAYIGDLDGLKAIFSLWTEEQQNGDHFKLRGTLGFALAVINHQLKMANYLLSKNPDLQIYVIYLMQAYESSLKVNFTSEFAKNRNTSILYEQPSQDHSFLIDNDQSQISQFEPTKGNPSAQELADSPISAKSRHRLTVQHQKQVSPEDSNPADQTSEEEDSKIDFILPPKRQGTTAQGSNVNNRLYKYNAHENVSQEVSVQLLSYDLDHDNSQNMTPVEEDYSSPVNKLTESMTNFKSMEELTKFQKALACQHEHILLFNTNILKIALNLKEDKIGLLIISLFQVTIHEETLNYTIQQKFLNFIHYLFLNNLTQIKITDENSPNVSYSSNSDNEDTKYFTLTIMDLVQRINTCYQDQPENEKTIEILLNKVLSWRIDPEGNVLERLCYLGQEKVASGIMNSYPNYSSEDFLIKCIQEERQYFIKQALLDQFFNLDYMCLQRVIEIIVQKLIQGTNILFYLNLLLYTNFRKWDNKYLKQFTSACQLIISNELEKNILLISHNPIMTLGLTIQFLKRLKNDLNEFDTECQKLVEKFEILGKLIIENMQYDHVEEFFLDKDFQDRTVLKIITDNQIMTFIVISKLHFLIDKIWSGKDSDLIDGKTLHFSKTEYLLNHEIKRIKGVQVSFQDIIGENFKPNIFDYNFNFQKQFREQSVWYIFLKDFVCALSIVVIFQMINYSYLNLFTERAYSDAPTEEAKIAIISENLRQYKQLTYFGSIVSVSFFLNFFHRVIYNRYTKKKIPNDLWLYFDLISGLVTIVAFNVVGSSEPEKILNVYGKRAFDYYMILVLMVSWLRFFSYFLVISHISKITLTLFMMLFETIYFLLILSCYMVLMATVFATLFRDTETEDAINDYHSLLRTLRALVDYFLANYDVKEMGKYTTSHSILYILHVTISNIFLLNFLVAILQTVFDIMIKNGDFYAIQYQYIFITKFMKAIDEANGYDQLIVTPPPLNIFLFPMIICAPFKQKVQKLAEIYSMIFFWIDNIFQILYFFLTMLVFQNPLIMIKTFYQICTKIDGSNCFEGFLKKIFYLLGWAILGLPFLIVVNFKDLLMFINILCMKNSAIFNQGEEERSKSELLAFHINKNVIRSVKILKEIGDSSNERFESKKKLKRLQTQKMNIIDKNKNLNHEMLKEDIYIVSKFLVIAVYVEISIQDKFIYQHRHSNLPPEKRQQYDQKPQGETVKEPQISPELRSLAESMMLNDKDSQKDFDNYCEKNEANFIPYSDEESAILESFMDRFTLLKQNQETETLDIDLIVKAFPQVIKQQTIKKIQLLNFKKMQRILISFFNDDQDEMFNYYDNRMTRRLDQLKEVTNKNSNRVDGIFKNSISIYNHIKGRMLNNAVANNNEPGKESSRKLGDKLSKSQMVFNNNADYMGQFENLQKSGTLQSPSKKLTVQQEQLTIDYQARVQRRNHTSNAAIDENQPLENKRSLFQMSNEPTVENTRAAESGEINKIEPSTGQSSLHSPNLITGGIFADPSFDIFKQFDYEQKKTLDIVKGLALKKQLLDKQNNSSAIQQQQISQNNSNLPPSDELDENHFEENTRRFANQIRVQRLSLHNNTFIEEKKATTLHEPGLQNYQTQVKPPHAQAEDDNAPSSSSHQQQQSSNHNLPPYAMQQTAEQIIDFLRAQKRDFSQDESTSFKDLQDQYSEYQAVLSSQNTSHMMRGTHNYAAMLSGIHGGGGGGQQLYPTITGMSNNTSNQRSSVNYGLSLPHQRNNLHIGSRFINGNVGEGKGQGALEQKSLSVIPGGLKRKNTKIGTSTFKSQPRPSVTMEVVRKKTPTIEVSEEDSIKTDREDIVEDSFPSNPRRNNNIRKK